MEESYRNKHKEKRKLQKGTGESELQKGVEGRKKGRKYKEKNWDQENNVFIYSVVQKHKKIKQLRMLEVVLETVTGEGGVQKVWRGSEADSRSVA